MLSMEKFMKNKKHLIWIIPLVLIFLFIIIGFVGYMIMPYPNNYTEAEVHDKLLGNTYRFFNWEKYSKNSFDEDGYVNYYDEDWINFYSEDELATSYGYFKYEIKRSKIHGTHLKIYDIRFADTIYKELIMELRFEPHEHEEIYGEDFVYLTLKENAYSVAVANSYPDFNNKTTEISNSTLIKVDTNTVHPDTKNPLVDHLSNIKFFGNNTCEVDIDSKKLNAECFIFGDGIKVTEIFFILENGKLFKLSTFGNYDSGHWILGEDTFSLIDIY